MSRTTAPATAPSSTPPSAASAIASASTVPPAASSSGSTSGDGEAACRRLWREGGIRVLPGGYLSVGEQGSNAGSAYIRVALVDEPGLIDTALGRLGEILEAA